MSPELLTTVRNNKDLYRFVQTHPSWYRYLSRHPRYLEKAQKEAIIFAGKSIPQRIDKLSNQVQAVQFLLEVINMNRG
ncbi:hypothetical protein FLK61_33180 [Paenalkalicoccus suaedae]|uniref:YlbE-like protein n=1 Tax=Paenalkalicoccus suaedae TaxID=2592382 RepID=A0A859FH62_9BACI|nr:YlbE-like family protein [Paenalkalicoccus suaedae]QKS71545.1 hypothetical protein FLK61_33180 [Paenalkalicoccus suaedae]